MQRLNKRWILGVIGIVVVAIAITAFFIRSPRSLFQDFLISFILHETKGIQSLQTINTAEEQYRQSYPQRGYSRTLAELGGPCSTPGPPSPSAACLIDQALADASIAARAKSGYVYTYVAGPPNAQGVIESYSVHSDPANERSGTNHFYTDETYVIRVEKNKLANKNSPIKKLD